MAPALQVSVPVLGQVMTAMLLCSALLGLVIGPLADRSGYRPVILLGLAAAALTLFTFGLAPTVLVLGVASLTGGLADAAGLGPSLALAGTHFPGTAGRRAVAWANGAEALAAIIGVPVLTAIGATAGWRVAFLAVGIGALGVLGSAVLWLPHHGRHPADRLRLETILAPYRSLLRDAGMQRLYAARALGGVCVYGLLTELGAFLAHALGLGTEAIGLVYMLAGSAFFLGSLAVGGPLAGVPMPRLAVCGYAAMALLMGLALSARLGPIGSIGLITAAALAMGIGIVSMITLFLAETPSGAGTTLTLGGSIFNLGAAGRRRDRRPVAGGGRVRRLGPGAAPLWRDGRLAVLATAATLSRIALAMPPTDPGSMRCSSRGFAARSSVSKTILRVEKVGVKIRSDAPRAGEAPNCPDSDRQ
jgi:predicted MFS family arabinose efflux permease